MDYIWFAFPLKSCLSRTVYKQKERKNCGENSWSNLYCNRDNYKIYCVILIERWCNKMITRFKQQIDTPYSLHDMIVRKITCRNESVYLEFSYGYVSTKAPCPQVDGNITIEDVDMDCACVLLLSELGKYGDFEGTKMSLKDFIEKYSEYYFEILDELYGFNQVEYIGYLRSPQNDELIQMSLSMYFTGDIVYETEE